MTANRFFLPQPAAPGTLVRVEGPEHHHLRRVARVRSGLVPEIRPPQNLEDYLRGEDSDLKLVLSEHGGTYL